MYQQKYLIFHDYQSKGLVPYLEQRHKKGHLISLLARFPITRCAFFLPLERRRWQKQNRFFVQTMVVFDIFVLGVQIPAHGGCTWLAIILVNMMIVVAPAA